MSNKMNDGIWIVKNHGCSMHKICDLTDLNSNEDAIVFGQLVYEFQDDLEKAALKCFQDHVYKTYSINEKTSEISFSLPSVNEFITHILNEVAKNRIKNKLKNL